MFLGRPVAAVPGAPGAVTLTPTVLGSSSIRLTASASADAGFKEWTFEFATAALGPFVPLTTQLSPVLDVAPLSPSTQYWFRAKALTNANQATAYSSTATATTSAPVVAPLVLDTAFYGLTLVTTADYGDSKNCRLDGTDAETAQVFDMTRPRLYNGPFEIQVVSDGTHTPDETFTITTVTGQDDLPSPGNALQVVRNYDLANACQVAGKFLCAPPYTSQGIISIGVTFRVPTGYPVTTNHQFTLTEIKSQGGNSPYPVLHLLLSREDIGGTNQWCTKLVSTRIDGANSYETWGTEFAQSGLITVTPSQDSYNAGKFFKVIPSLVTEGWGRAILATRLKTHNGNVAGNGPEGWVAVYYGEPNVDGSPKDWDQLTLQTFVTGRNLGYVNEPTADYVFVMNHYNTLVSGANGKAIKFRSRCHDDWFPDGPTRPAGAA